jgi:phosphate:Na+ symporter
MSYTLLLELFGGLAIFVFGMKILSEGLLKSAGGRLRLSLERLAGTIPGSASLGASLSMLLQSGSAASVLAIGMTDAGLLSLHQLLAALVGTTVGTTFSVQFIAFRFSLLSYPLITVGVFLRFFSRQRRLVNAGEVILGIGLMFLGLKVMEGAFAVARDQAFGQFFSSTLFAREIPVYLLGVLLAFLMQSGSAAVAVVIALASTGTLSLDRAALMVAGEVVGTSLMAIIASWGGSGAARRAAWNFFLLSLSLSCLVALLRLPILEFFSRFWGETPSPAAIPRQLASFHTVVAFTVALVSLSLLPWILRVGERLPLRGASPLDEEPRPRFLDAKILSTPSLAFMQSRRELERMAEVATRIYATTVTLFDAFDPQKATRILRLEQVMDILQREITHFLVRLSRTPLTQEQSARIPYMLTLVDNLEHVGDQCERLLKLLSRKKESGLLFSEQAMADLKLSARQVQALTDMSLPCITAEPSPDIELVRTALERTRELLAQANSGHIRRLRNGHCSVQAGLLYGDMLASLSRIADIAAETARIERDYHDVSREGLD